MRKRRFVRAAVIIASWSLFALLMAVQEHYDAQAVHRPRTWRYVFRAEFASAYVWAALTPLILWLAQRFPVDHHAWYRAAPVHVMASLAIVIVQRLAYVALVPPSSPEWRIHDPASLTRYILVMMDYGILLYAMVLLIHYAVKYYARYQEGRIRASQLETRLAQAQLQALKMQLHPHFLFNTLHSISSLVQENPDAAEAMIARLSELLRLSLENTGLQEVPLRTELEFVERYLEIEQIRFDDRLQVRFDIEPQTLDAEVPNLILQPLVENAIRHGILPDRAALIQICSRLTGGKLLLKVVDNGPGLSCENPSSLAGCGVGLSNTRARLAAAYGKEHDFILRAASNGGVEAVILIPPRAPSPVVRHDGNGKNQDVHRG